MGMFKEWEKNIFLNKQIKEYKTKIRELESIIEIIKRNSKDEKINENLLKEILHKDKEFKNLFREYESLREWTNRLLTISKEESSELTYIKFRYFNILKDHRILEMNLVGADKSLAFANNRFEQIREENQILKEKLREYEKNRF